MGQHVIVCGMGQIGYHVVSLLLGLGCDVSVISLKAREEWVRDVTARGANVLHGDSRDVALLREAGIESATSIVACTSDDTLNIEIGLDAQRLNPKCRAIVRIFDLNLATRLEELFGLEALSTSSVAGSAFASAAFGEEVVTEFKLGDQRYLVLRSLAQEKTTIQEWSKKQGFPVLMRVTADGSVHTNPSPTMELASGDTVKMVGLASEMRRLRKQHRQHHDLKWLLRWLRQFNPLRFIGTVWRDTTSEVRDAFLSVTVVILASILLFGYGLKLSITDAIYFVVETVTTVGYGDITPRHGPEWVVILSYLLMITGVVWMVLMYVIVTDYLVASRLDQVTGRRGGPDKGHTIVVGIGDVGLRTAEALAHAGIPVIAVDRNKDSRHMRAASGRVATLIGDSREPEILKRARVETADSIVVTTNDDATNLSVSLAAKSLNPKIRAVVRIFDGEFAHKIDEARVLEGAFSAARLTSPTFAGAALFSGVVASFVMHSHLIVLSKDRSKSPGSFELEVRGGASTHTLTVHSLPLSS